MQARRLLLIGFTLFGSLALAGCKNRELVENELRARDTQYREALEELSRSEARNDALQRELETIRKGANLTPDQMAQISGLRRIVLGRLTGGYDNDGLPGDEALQVIIEPRDASDRPIQSGGQAEITALEINPQGVKTPLATWTVAPETLRQSWKQGLLSTGYTLILPWKTLPRSENVRVIVRLSLADGRVYEADKDVKVRLVPSVAPGAPPKDVPPRIFPGEEVPLVVPSLKQTYPNVPIGQWYVPPLEGVIELGRPVAHVPRQDIWPDDDQ